MRWSSLALAIMMTVACIVAPEPRRAGDADIEADADADAEADADADSDPDPDPCGNGNPNDGEACDDGNNLTEDECPYGTPNCLLCSADCSLVLELTGQSCGDGVDDEEEACDDNDTTTETECAYGTPVCTACRNDCSQVLNLAGEYCGDGVENGAETCDDGDTETETACPYGILACTLCAGACDQVLDLNGSFCGDGTFDAGETCDDGDETNADACPDGVDGTCEPARCGDGHVWTADGGNEICDDGNTVAGDGCASTCGVESGYHCQTLWSPCVAVVNSCTNRADFTLCDTTATPNLAYDICVDSACVTPGHEGATNNTPGPHFPLADTGMRSCYDGSGVIPCPVLTGCEGTAFCGQDAQYGWDVDHSSGRFGRSLRIASQPVVQDTVTGMTWQGCMIGQSGAGCEGSPTEYTSRSNASSACEGITWGGYTDWRLPDIYELLSVVDRAVSGYTFDATAFPHAGEGTAGALWTSMDNHSPNIQDWLLGTSDGRITATGARGYSRCVRGRPAPYPETRFVRSTIVAGQPVVADFQSGLVWQGCDANKTGDQCTVGTSLTYDWPQALQYCQELYWGGEYDWRLPDINELVSIVDYRTSAPSMDPELYGSAERYWSSTTRQSYIPHAWIVNFYYGLMDGWEKAGTQKLQVRCVRSD